MRAILKELFSDYLGSLLAESGYKLSNTVLIQLRDKNLKQREIAVLLRIKKAEVSYLLNGHFSCFSVDKLLDFLKELNQKVTRNISC